MNSKLIVVLLSLSMIIVLSACGGGNKSQETNKEETVHLTAEEMVNRLNDGSEYKWEHDDYSNFESPDGEKYYFQTNNVYTCESGDFVHSAGYVRSDKEAQETFKEMISELQFQAKEIERYTGSPCEIILHKGGQAICIVDAKHTIYDYVNGMQDSTATTDSVTTTDSATNTDSATADSTSTEGKSSYITIEKAIDMLNKSGKNIGTWVLPDGKLGFTKTLYYTVTEDAMDVYLARGLDERASDFTNVVQKSIIWMESATGIEDIKVMVFSPYKDKCGAIVTADNITTC